MKKQSGFTLVELMVVASITVLLLAWGVPSYHSWKKKHDIENQMVQLYSDLQVGRMTAYSRKAASGVYWGTGASIATTTSYQIRYDADNDGIIDNDSTSPNPIKAAAIKYPIAVSTGTGNPSQNSVIFDGRGFLSPIPPAVTAYDVTFYVTPNSGAAIDCVAVSSTRVILGKMNGVNCARK